MPLEVELYRNYQYSVWSRRLQERLQQQQSKGRSINSNKQGKTKKNWEKSSTSSSSNVGDDDEEDKDDVDLDVDVWYGESYRMIATEMERIVQILGPGGRQIIDPNELSDDDKEMLTMYLHHQECWQEVCLVLEKHKDGQAKTVVLNRPMALQLTENLAQLLLFGAYNPQRMAEGPSSYNDMVRFITAFKKECYVYSGGPDNLGDGPAILIHGIATLPGAVEISPGTKIYRGGLKAAVDGILTGQHSPLEFRFFVGCHQYKENDLDRYIRLSKYQPVACARTVALKQCISLPKPLWHEGMYLL
jgi:hypothetical protein